MDMMLWRLMLYDAWGDVNCGQKCVSLAAMDIKLMVTTYWLCWSGWYRYHGDHLSVPDRLCMFLTKCHVNSKLLSSAGIFVGFSYDGNMMVNDGSMSFCAFL